MTSYLYSQAERVEHNEHKHDVLKPGGVHHVPELVLVRVLRDVPPQWTGLQSVLHTLTLHGNTQRRFQCSFIDTLLTSQSNLDFLT